MKRYRRPKVIEGQIKMQRGRVDGDDPDMCIFYGDDTPRCDRALVMNTLCFNTYDTGTRESKPSLIDELEARGYDLDTLQFSIKRKVI
jgi:hypothetical protein